MDWPITYLKRRAAFRKGKQGEEFWIKKKFKTGSKKNEQFTEIITNENGTQERVNVIPDYITSTQVGDVKNVATQSNTKQMKAIKLVADRKNKKFSVIVRNTKHPNGKTHISVPLSRTALIHRVVDSD